MDEGEDAVEEALLVPDDAAPDDDALEVPFELLLLSDDPSELEVSFAPPVREVPPVLTQ